MNLFIINDSQEGERNRKINFQDGEWKGKFQINEDVAIFLNFRKIKQQLDVIAKKSHRPFMSP